MCFNYGLWQLMQAGATAHTQYSSTKMKNKPMVEYFFGDWFRTHNISGCVQYNETFHETCRGHPGSCAVRNFGMAMASDRGLNIVMFRQLFEAQEHVRKTLGYAWPGVDRSALTVSLHIRRDDILQPRYQNRAVPNFVYMSLLNRVIPALQQKFGNVVPIHVVVNAQGSPNASAIIDYDKNYSDFKAALKHHKVVVSTGPDDPLQAFSVICNSHVALLSGSSFSATAIILCKKPLFIGPSLGKATSCSSNALIWNKNRSVGEEELTSYIHHVVGRHRRAGYSGWR
jgi:hypothetical protein